MTGRKTKIHLKKAMALMLSIVMLFMLAPGTNLRTNAEGASYAVTVTTNGSVTGYSSLYDAWNALKNVEVDGSIVTLYADAWAYYFPSLSRNITMDLNGFTFTNGGSLSGSGSIAFNSKKPGTFISTEEGSIGINIQTLGADNITIAGGYNTGGFGFDAGTINITGGIFTGDMYFDNGGNANVTATISGTSQITKLEIYGNNTSSGAPTMSVTLAGGYYAGENIPYFENDNFPACVTIKDIVQKYEEGKEYKPTWKADDPNTHNFRVISSKTSLEDAVIDEISDQLFTGDPITPKLKVTLYGKTLTEGTDYTTSYSNNIFYTMNYKAAKATITGKGNCIGSKKEGFNIVGSDADPAAITNGKVTLVSLEDGEIESNEYGKVKGKVATLKVEFDRQNNIKNYSAVVFNSDNMKAVTGNQPHMVVSKTNKTYFKNHGDNGTVVTEKGPNGETITQTDKTITAVVKVVNPTDNKQGPGFKEGEDIQVGISASRDSEIYKSGDPEEVVVKVPFDKASVGKTYNEKGEVKSDNSGNGGSEKTTEATTEATTEKNVDAKSISKAEVTIADQTYTGKALTPEAVVTLDGKNLKQGTDFDVTYKNNTNAGKATAEITGKGDYKDSVTTQFDIKAMALKPTLKLAKKSYTYDGKVKNPGVTVTSGKTTYKKGTDYTVTYQKGRKNVGKYNVTVKMKGNYSGTGKATFTINKAKNTLKVTVKKVTVKKNKLRKKKVTIKRSKALKVKSAKGAVTYAKAKGNKKISINKNTGKITIKKGLKKGKYNVKVKIKAAGNKNFKGLTLTKTVKIVVK